MRFLAVSSHFQKQLKTLSPYEQQKAASALKGLLSALQTGQWPAGYGFKKINGDKYELRVDIRTRIVMKADGEALVCHLIGNHDEIKRYLRAYRNK